jgi:phosphoribosylamine--glycine ligase
VKILVVGSGGREHALIWKLAQSSVSPRLFCAPGNAGTQALAENVGIPAQDLPKLARFAKENRIDLTVVGPDDALAAGIVDLFVAEGLRIFGPTKSAARIESSKIFAKELMAAEKIPTAVARTFTENREALDYLAQVQFPIVVKADGLALGKGVIIAADKAAAKTAVAEMMESGRFGEAGRKIVIEKFLRGTECSLHALVDGRNYRLLATARDHKRALEGDRGPNTGGMGAFSPADTWNPALESQFHEKIMEPLLRGWKERKIEFRGLLFPGLMVTEQGATVLEFNARFGDPETQVILPRLKSDLVQLLATTIDGTLDKVAIDWDPRAAVTVVLASGGYPDKYETGKTIHGLEAVAKMPDVQIFHAGTRRENGTVVTAGGRVLAVTALGNDIPAARERAYQAVAQIHFEGCRFRRDIALSAVAAKIVAH